MTDAHSYGALAVAEQNETSISRRPAPPVALPDHRYLRFKYGVDRVLAVAALLFLLPVIALVALGVRVTMGSGVIYSQRRVGEGRRIFTMYKFRTMQHDRRQLATDVPVDRRRTHKTEADPRHTPFGRLLRKTSLDELPQLLNVARGEMAIIGPRPELVSVVEAHDLWHHPRHLIRPGITGMWQVSEYRHELLHHNLHVDVDYLEQVSFRTDMDILRRTVGAVAGSTGS